MTEARAPSLIERKIAAARPRTGPLAMTPARAFERGFARVAEKQAEMAVRLASASEAGLSGAEVVETLPDQPLILMTGGPGGGTGLAVFAPDAVACLIEMLTLGRLAARAPAPRRPTRTDAAMIAGFLDAALAEADVALAAQEDVVWAGGFRFALHLADPRPLPLMLEEPAYRVLRLTFRCGEEEGRQAAVSLIFPAQGRGARPVVPQEPAAEDADPTIDGGIAAAEWAERLARAAAAAPAEVGAVLARLNLPLADFLALETGTLLPLPMSALQEVRVEGQDGALLCLAHLGQSGGHRALRLRLAEGEAGAPPVHPGEALPAHAPPAVRAEELTQTAVAVAAAQAAEAAADRIMEEAMAGAAQAG
jgi:flagellar motor switch protein FliM